VTKGNDEISMRIWEGILHECQQDKEKKKKKQYRKQNITGTKTEIWVFMRTDQFGEYPPFLYARSAFKGQGKVGSLYVPHSATFVLFNNALFFTRDDTVAMIYHHDDIIPD
jgi:hypothetical protein